MGRPKEWLDFGGVSLLEHMLWQLLEVVQHVVVVAAPEQALPPLPSSWQSWVRIVRDPLPYPGPLVGLLTGWLALPPTVEAVLVLAVDLPGVRPFLLRQLLQWLHEEPTVDAVIPRLTDRWQPLLAAYRRSALPVLQTLVDRGSRRLQDLAQTLHVRPVTLELLRTIDPLARCLDNLNTPADYARALAQGSESPRQDPPPESRHHLPPSSYTVP
jgi:molybdopterin-guanine dinucleotide biosynthesis protein A